MQAITLFGSNGDDRGVSPVIGVVLMVTATVIIGGVVASFVMGMGSGLESAPQASFGFAYDDTNLTITHEGGATIQDDRLSVVVVDDQTYNVNVTDHAVSTGTVIFDHEVDSNATVRVIWTDSNGDKTTPLAKWVGPTA